MTEKDVPTPEQHSAGATIRHRGPFSSLPLPATAAPMNDAFKRRWVIPFYGQPVRDASFAHAFRAMRRDITPDLVTALLAPPNWRPRTVAARFAAIELYREFEEPIGNLLLRSDVCYVGRDYCMALAAFNTPRSLSFLQRYLEHYLTTLDLWFDQGAAMAGVAYLDSVNGTREIEAFMEPWSRFVANKPQWDLRRSIDHFTESMAAIASLRQTKT